MNVKQKLQQGFTLIELAVVLVIVGILLSGVIGTLATRIENTRKSETIDELNEIKQAMLGFAFVYGGLPCPDCVAVGSGANCLASSIGDGISDATGTGLCEVPINAAGNVPWATLGVGRSDAWGTRYRYAVQNEYANTITPFKLDASAGAMKVFEPDFVSDPTGASAHPLANSLVAVIFSHGKNGLGGMGDNGVARAAIPSTHKDELKNTDDDANAEFYTRAETTSGATIDGGEFDDYVIWISEYELKAKMVEAGQLP